MSRNEATYRNALPLGRELHWYAIDRVLGQGAFGITYLAKDVNLDRRVAIKEFFPGQLAARDATHTVEPLSSELADEYTFGRQRFISEAQTLAKFEHPNIVRVHNVFESNNTAYMVMHYEDGRSLDSILKEQGTLSEEQILGLVFPLLSGLETIHQAGFIHRDIKPANIFLRADNTPVLIDFGSARQALQDHTRTLTNFVSPGYAPIEQYTGKSDKQGPWSDIYGLGATLYRATVGQAPADAVERGEAIAHDASDTFRRVMERAQGRYRPGLLRAIDHALQFRIQDRPQSVADWRDEFAHLDDLGFATVRAVPATDATTRVVANTEPVTQPITEPVTAPVTRPATAGPATIDRTVPIAPPGMTAAAPAAAEKRWPLPRTVAVAATFLVVFGAAYFVFDRPPAPSAPQASDGMSAAPVAPTETVAPDPAAAIADPFAPAALSPPAPTEPVSPETRIPALLAAASADLAALRLTTPRDNNAHDKYREVLALAPSNRAARRGLEAIADRYLQLAYRDIEARRFDRAKSYLDKSEQLAPGRAPVRDARAALAAAQAPASNAQRSSFSDKIDAFGKRFDDFVKQQEPPRQENRGDAFLRQLRH